MNKIIYIANIRLPTEKAHGIQIMKTCEALAKSGVEVELVVPARNKISEQEIFDFYKVQLVFKIFRISVPSIFFNSKIGFLFNSLMFSFKSVNYARRKGVGLIYSRDKFPLFLSSLIGIRSYFESHTGGWGIGSAIILNRIDGIVCITQGLRDFYKEHNIPNNRLIVAPDAVDINLFDHLHSKEDSRRELGLPFDKKIIMYVGSFSLYKWKGLDVFLESAKFFGETYLFVAVGGNKKEMEEIIAAGLSPNVKLIERVNNSIIPKYLISADVLIVPNKSGDIVSEKYTSPMKLFEYMASGVPIVASDLPSIREIINDSNGVLVGPDSPKLLSEGIKLAILPSNRRSLKALEDVKTKYSWQKRADLIRGFIFSEDEK